MRYYRVYFETDDTLAIENREVPDDAPAPLFFHASPRAAICAEIEQYDFVINEQAERIAALKRQRHLLRMSRDRCAARERNERRKEQP